MRVQVSLPPLFLGVADAQDNRRNGYEEKQYALKGVGAIRIRVPVDRKNRFESAIIPKHERMDLRSKALEWLERPITRPYWALYIDGTNFSVQRRGNTEKEPSLVIVGVDEENRRSILSIESRTKNCYLVELSHVDPYRVCIGDIRPPRKLGNGSW